MAEPTLYQQVLGGDFERLPTAVRDFHLRQGNAVYVGETDILGPQTLAAAIMARLLGTPRESGHGAIRFELSASPREERWTRIFVGRTMVSSFRVADGQLVEHLGPARLRFALLVEAGLLRMKLIDMSFFRIPCPGWLLPQIVAEESECDGRLNFNVAAHLPWIGRVVSYRGYLEPAAGNPP